MKEKIITIIWTVICATAILAYIAFSSLSFSNESLNLQQDDKKDFSFPRIPMASGAIKITDNNDVHYYCSATLIKSDEILTDKHCLITHAPIKDIKFKVVIGKTFDVFIPEKVKPINDINDMNKDVKILKLKQHIYSIKPLKISDEIKTDKSSGITKLTRVIVPYAPYVFHSRYDAKNINLHGWQECDFRKPDFAKNILISDKCIFVNGYSGSPFLQSFKNEWKIVGIYHSFIDVSQTNKTEKYDPLNESFTQYGVATLSNSWKLN